MRKSKLDINILVHLKADLSKVIELVYPDEIVRPSIAFIEYIGLAAMGLEDICTPVKVQVQFHHNFKGVFTRILKDYISKKYPNLSCKRYDNISDLTNKSVHF